LGFGNSILLFERWFDPQSPLPYRLYFPFTLTYHFVRIGGVTIDRVVGLWREPGLYQMFIIVSFFALDFVHIRKKPLLKVLLILSLLATFSTAGYVVLLVCLAYKHLLLRPIGPIKKIVVAIVLVALLGAYALVPKIGLTDKLGRSEKRLLSPQVSWQLLMQRPIVGYGITSEEQFVPGVKLGVNMLASLHKMGLGGLSIWITILVWTTMTHHRRFTLTPLISVILTLLVAQPTYASSFTFFMLLLPTRDLEVYSPWRRRKIRYRLPDTLSSSG
jgi:hypothetical protein